MGSCLSRASSGAFMDPIVTVSGDGCEMKGIGLGGVKIEAGLKISNPNMVPIHGTNITYKVRKVSDGTGTVFLAEGSIARDFKIGPSETQTVMVPMTLKYKGVGSVSSSLVRRGESRLEVAGELTFTAPMTPKGTVDIPYTGRVSVALPSL